MPKNCGGPIGHSRFMHNTRAQKPIHTWDGMTAVQMIEKGYGNSAYQGRNMYSAARIWAGCKKAGDYTWLGMSGAATPAGLGGLVAQLIRRGAVDAVVTTGANVYHDLHYIHPLPVRQGTPHIDDDKAASDNTTRIYDQFVHNNHTLGAEDKILQDVLPRAFHRMPNIHKRYSSAELLNALGHELLEDKKGLVKTPEGSFVLAAAECDVPIYMDSGSNHTPGMDLALLARQGYPADISPTMDIDEATAFSVQTQPQLNIFLGEGGPRNFIQTLGPVASETYYIIHEGSDGALIFSTGIEQTGSLTGSTISEAKSWKKYKEAHGPKNIHVWGEYTQSFLPVAHYVCEKAGQRPLKRLWRKRNEYMARFDELVKQYEPRRKRIQRDIMKKFPRVQRAEIRARRQAAKTGFDEF